MLHVIVLLWALALALGSVSKTMRACKLRVRVGDGRTSLSHEVMNTLELYYCVLNVCVQDVVRTMAEKIGFRNPADDCLCFSLHECRDGVTSTRMPWVFELLKPVFWELRVHFVLE